MQRAKALARVIAPLVAVVVLSAGCASAPAGAKAGVPAAAPGSGSGVQANGVQAGPVPTGTAPAATGRVIRPAALPPGTLYLDPATGRREVIEADISRTAVLIGDSQSEGAAGVSAKNTWPCTALAKLGFQVQFRGRGGTGYVAANGKIGNYPDALERGNWHLPYGPAPLVVIEGGGNDASHGATDAQILANAARLLRDLKQTYPTSRFVMIGALAKGAAHGGGRRTQVDTLLGSFAAANAIPFISAGNWLTKYALTNKMADGVHLTAAGHQVLSGVLLQELLRLGVAAPARAGGAVVAKTDKTDKPS
ncbi:MAG: SGNH/GDSL hydrolase family protein [Actinomycetota bacterium]|nr:SGNH/GDSL hydrolase family protein [Actinomycetota bacterium]